MVVLPDPGHGHPDLDRAAFLRLRREETRQGLWRRGRPRTLSGVARSKKGFLRGGKGHSVLLDWTGLRSAGAAAFLPAPQLA